MSDTEFQASAKVAVGPVKATFKGKVLLSDIDAAERLQDRGRGPGRRCGLRQGRRQGAARRTRKAAPRLTYDVEAQIGGKLAQLGGRLINGVAKKMADEFFANFAKAAGAGRDGVALGGPGRRNCAKRRICTSEARGRRLDPRFRPVHI